jgi:hypothetical protein
VCEKRRGSGLAAGPLTIGIAIAFPSMKTGRVRGIRGTA